MVVVKMLEMEMEMEAVGRGGSVGGSFGGVMIVVDDVPVFLRQQQSREGCNKE